MHAPPPKRKIPASMKTSEFHYDLPAELIAQHPLPGRSDSRLMRLDRRTGKVRHRHITDLPEMLRPGDLMVFNDTRVIPARLRARKETGGRAEILIERLRDPRHCIAQLRVSKKPAPGARLVLENGQSCTVTGREGAFFRLTLDKGEWQEILSSLGHVPLPPYIERADTSEDRERYQTVYSRRPGAVAAPTAGLHFDPPLLQRLERAGVNSAFLTLHVGAGTFQPVRTERIEEHRMHSEYLEVSGSVCAAVHTARQAGGRVVAVGTTSVRSLETAARGGELQPYRGDSDIFIYPGFEFRVVDALLTNFHLPESTLLMLVSAFAGRENVLAAYRQAVSERYRFFSYGDAMLIE